MPSRIADIVRDDFHLKSLPSNINSRGYPAPHSGKRDAGLGQRRVNLARMYVAPLIAAGTKQPKATCAQ
jgi:hypothetical protein